MLTSIPKRVFFSLCDGYFGFGTRSREYLMSLGAKQDKIFIPCQAAALPRSFSPETAIADRVALSRRAVAPVFLFVGRLSEEKGIGTLARCVRGLEAAHSRCDAAHRRHRADGRPVEAEGRRYRPLRFRAFPRQPAGRAALARIFRRHLHGAAEHERTMGPRHQRGAEPRLSGHRERELRLRAGTGDRRRDAAMRFPRAMCRRCSARCSSRWRRSPIRRASRGAASM